MRYGLEAIFSLSFVPPGLKPIPLFREMPLGRPFPLPLFFLSSFILFHFQEGQGLRNGWLREETMSFCPGPSSVPCCSLLGSSSSTQVSLCPWHPSSLMLEARVSGAVLNTREVPIRELSLHPVSSFPLPAVSQTFIPLQIKKKHIYTYKYRSGLRRKLLLFSQPLNQSECQALF